MEQTAGTPARTHAARITPSAFVSAIVLFLILACALALRLYGVNWDSGQNIHPDERAISGWVNGLQFPHSPFDLFDRNSFWNPSMRPDGSHDPAGFNYGSLPLYLIFIFGHIMDWLSNIVPGWSSWHNAYAYGTNILAGRVLSALADTVTVFLVYLIGARLAGRATGLFAAALASVAVLSIQLSHFATVDILLTTFATGTLLAAIDLFTTGRPRNYAIAGVWLAAAIATKASALPFVAVVLIAHLWRRGREGKLLEWGTIWDLWPALAAGVPALFLFQPYMFSDWSDFWTGVTGQSDLADGSQIVFYTIKWHGTKPLIYPLQQLTYYSLGIPLALLAYAGVLYEGVRLCTKKRNAGALVACFAVIYFVSAGVLYMKYLRYMEPIVPALCILAALLVSAMARTRSRLLGRFLRPAGIALGALVLALTACYGLAYEHIYAEPLTRVQASCWIYQHIPGGATIAQDNPDEGLPLNSCNNGRVYPQANGQSMPEYDPESWGKIQTIAGILAHANYYIISSFRAIETFDHDAVDFPVTHRFYQLLLGSKQGAQDPLGFTLVKYFAEHPQLGPWTFDDYSSNQNFNEYDHPPVWIFRNTGHLSANAIFDALTDSGRINLLGQGFGAQGTIATPPKSLLLTPRQIAANQHAPSYGQMFPPDSLPMKLPIPVWWAMVELIGLLALPISMRLFGRLRDCGFVIAKTAGILLLSWFAWILPSIGVAEYSRAEIALGLVPLAGISLAWGVRPRDAARILRGRLGAIALTEGAFLLGFAFFVFLRMLYPDMWHVISGGEKTMDFSFLNAIVRSRALPPYDPWFSGGYLNYYYYGHFTVATLLKLAGIAPAIAINLAIPTFFALALATCVSIGYSLLGRVSYAALAGIFALLSGNLYAAQVLIGDLQAASPLHGQLRPVADAGSTVPIVGGIVDLVSGAWALFSGLVRGTLATILGIGQVLLGHAQLPQTSFNYGWPWDQSRIIDNHTIITEYPYWTFLFADPHAHMWDVPFALCILALAFNFATGGPAFAPHAAGEADGEGGDAVAAAANPPGGPRGVAAARPLLPGGAIVVWPVMGAIIGAVGPTNPWDLALMLGAVALAIGARSLWLRRGWTRTIIGLVWRMAALVVFAFGLYAPFYTHFQSFYSHIGLTLLRHQTPIGDFLTHWGFFILLLISYLAVAVLADTNVGLWLRARVRAALFVMYYWDRRAELPRYFALVRHAAERSGAPRRFADLSGPAKLVVLCGVALVALLALIQYAVLALLAAMIAAALLLLVDRRERYGSSALFLHLLIVLGLGAAAAAEIVYVKDFYDGDPLRFRTNTVFKIYEEAWLIIGIAAAISLARLLAPFLHPGLRLRSDGSVTPTAVGSTAQISPDGLPAWGTPRSLAHDAEPIHSEPTAVGVVSAMRPQSQALPHLEARVHARPGSWAWTWLAVAALLFVGAEIGPIRTTPLRVQERQTWDATRNAPAAFSLDGSEFIKYAYPGEYAAIQWINQTIPGSPVMLQSRWGGYRDFAARVTMFTGLPSVVNWGFEDAQQRYSGQDAGDGTSYPDEVTPRETDVDTIYSTPDPQEALALLHKYNVSFVYVGQFEKHGFPDDVDPNNPNTYGHLGYPPSGIAKFALMAASGQLQLAYNHFGVQIYCVGRCPSYITPVRR